jgi:hypothetical protein
MRALALPLLFACLPAHAEPGSLKQAAIDQHRTDAKSTLAAAKDKASGLRQRAGDRSLVLKDRTKSTRGDIAKKLWGARGQLRTLRVSLKDTESQKAIAERSYETTKEELGNARSTMEASHAQLSWLARKLKFAIFKKGRIRLAQYKADKTAHDGIAQRSVEEQATLDGLVKKVSEFESGLLRLSKDIDGQHGRDISAEAEAAANAELVELEKQAVEVEQKAKESIHLLVKKYVSDKTASQRDPLQRAKNSAGKAVSLGGDADSAIAHAHTKIEEAQEKERMNALGDGLEVAFGGKNETADALFKLGRAFGDASATWTEQDAQRLIGHANSAVESFQTQVSQLKRDADAVKHGAGGIDSTADRVHANVTAVAYIDLVVNFTRFDSALTDLGAGGIEMIQLARAGNQLQSMRQSVARIRSQVSSLHDKLDDSLRDLDAQSAQIVSEAVAELMKE